LIALGLPRHSYADWVLSAGSQKSGQIVDLLENLLNRYMSLNTQQFSNYRYTLLCERDFLVVMGKTIGVDATLDWRLMRDAPSIDSVF
jgi:hypothetical protein